MSLTFNIIGGDAQQCNVLKKHNDMWTRTNVESVVFYSSLHCAEMHLLLFILSMLTNWHKLATESAMFYSRYLRVVLFLIFVPVWRKLLPVRIFNFVCKWRLNASWKVFSKNVYHKSLFIFYTSCHCFQVVNLNCSREKALLLKYEVFQKHFYAQLLG